MPAAASLSTAPFSPRLRRQHTPRSLHSRKVADLTAEDWYYDVELSRDRGRSTLLRRGDEWYDDQGTCVAASDDIEALYLPAGKS